MHQPVPGRGPVSTSRDRFEDAAAEGRAHVEGFKPEQPYNAKRERREDAHKRARQHRERAEAAKKQQAENPQPTTSPVVTYEILPTDRRVVEIQPERIGDSRRQHEDEFEKTVLDAWATSTTEPIGMLPAGIGEAILGHWAGPSPIEELAEREWPGLIRNTAPGQFSAEFEVTNVDPKVLAILIGRDTFQPTLWDPSDFEETAA